MGLDIDIFSIDAPQGFNEAAMQLFRLQSEHCTPYRAFLEGLQRPLPSHWREIPCLPVQAFKQTKVLTSTAPVVHTFTSSGTTSSIDAAHHITDMSMYVSSFERAFERVYGQVSDYCIIGLLPAYMERQGSSLVYMVEHLIRVSGHDKSGTYLYDYEALADLLEELRLSGQKTILFGVTFALLDMMEHVKAPFEELIIIETGGMKGRRKEMVREELHSQLKRTYGVSAIHSEYGMTELLSQAYSEGEGRYACPPWMGLKIRDINDPLSTVATGRTGGIDIIDLANQHSCAFISTQDLGRQYDDGSFEVLGRFDHSDVRGCSLLV